MAVRQDIALNNNDMVIKDNDWVWSESDEQHVADTINAFPGWWKENFADGVGILLYVNSKGQEQVLARSIKLNLQSDQYTVDNPTVSFVNSQLTINPNATINI